MVAKRPATATPRARSRCFTGHAVTASCRPGARASSHTQRSGQAQASVPAGRAERRPASRVRRTFGCVCTCARALTRALKSDTGRPVLATLRAPASRPRAPYTAGSTCRTEPRATPPGTWRTAAPGAAPASPQVPVRPEHAACARALGRQGARRKARLGSVSRRERLSAAGPALASGGPRLSHRGCAWGPLSPARTPRVSAEAPSAAPRRPTSFSLRRPRVLHAPEPGPFHPRPCHFCPPREPRDSPLAIPDTSHALARKSARRSGPLGFKAARSLRKELASRGNEATQSRFPRDGAGSCLLQTSLRG